MGHFSEQNFYEILEITPDATTEEIQKAFFRAKATYSPSSPALYSVFTEEEAQQLLRLIDEAYAILSNHSKRREYDQSVFGKSLAQNANASVTPIAPVNNMATDLPDFMLPGNEISSSPAPAQSPQTQHNQNHHHVPMSNPSASNGKKDGKTLMSHFNVDPEFEKEIAEQTTFDGTFLQKIRLYKNISLDQLSETSRISRPYILAVETNDFHSLPAPVYVRGFISSISRLLGLPEKKVIESYMKLFKDSREK
jgi:curved DNA-binding protein CbpA